MAVGLEQFVKSLEDSGILSPSKIQQFLPPQSTPKTAEELAKELVKKNHLTKFQAQEIYNGRAKSLILGGYTLLEKIGAGGMGEVYKAHHRRLDRTVAIKMLPKKMTKDASALARFEREVRAAAKLRHSNIVATDDADEAGGVHFLAMEYIAGSDLSALVKKNGPFSVEKAVDYVLQAARGLEFAHGEGVIHRDIKPSNLLLDKRGTVKILDMGLARIESGGIAATQAELTGSGAVMGTVDYMAPEQAMNTKRADARADIYSLGCSLYYLLTGVPLYGGETVVEKLMAHQTQPIPTLGSVRDDVPEALDGVLQKMLAKTPADRYQSMTEVIAALQFLLPSPLAGEGPGVRGDALGSSAPPDNSNLTFLNELPTRHTAQKKTEKPPQPQAAGAGNRRRKQILIASAFSGLALVLLAAIIVIIRNREGKEVARVEVQQASTNVAVQASGSPFDQLKRQNIPADKLKLAGGGDAALAPAELVAVFGESREKKICDGMQITPDGQRIFALHDYELRVWDVATGQQRPEWEKWNPIARALSSEGRWLALSPKRGGKSTSVVVLDTDTGKERITLSGVAPYNHTALALTMDGSRLAAALDRDIVKVWDTDSGQQLFELLTPGDTMSLAFSLDGKRLIAHSRNKEYSTTKGVILVWNAADGAEIFHKPTGSAYTSRTMAVSPDANWLVVRSEEPNKSLDVLELSKGEKLRTIDISNGYPGSVSPDGKHLVVWSAGKQSRVVVMNSESGKVLYQWAVPASLHRAAFSPDGHHVLTSNDDGTVSVFRFGTDKAPLTQSSSQEPVRTQAPFDAQQARVAPAADYALDFDGNGKVRIDSLALDSSKPFTVEVSATLASYSQQFPAVFVVGPNVWTLNATRTGERWQFQFQGKKTGSITASHPVVKNKRTCLAGVFDGKQVRLFVDGKLVSTTPVGADVPIASNTNWLEIGSLFAGAIDEARISNIARYENDFSPAPRLEPDANTLALYHFDEGAGDVLHDVTGHGRDGKITGAKWVRATNSALAPTTAAALPMQLLELKELNGFKPGFQFVSSDGRTIYWEDTKATGGAGPFISFAVRNSPNDSFVPQGILLDGNWRHPAVSDDGLQLVMVKSVGGLSRLYGASRTAVREPFGAPRELTEFDGVVAREKEGPCLSPDGLTLCFQAALEGAARLYVATRKKPTDVWSPPQPLHMEIGQLRPLITWPMLAEGGKVLFCSYEQAPGQARIMVWRRESLDQPFREFRFVEVDGKELIGYVARRYVKATSELYLTLHVNRRLFVVKNFRLTPEETKNPRL